MKGIFLNMNKDTRISIRTTNEQKEKWKNFIKERQLKSQTTPSLTELINIAVDTYIDNDNEIVLVPMDNVVEWEKFIKEKGISDISSLISIAVNEYIKKWR